MCETKKRTYGIELEGYTDRNIRGNHLTDWKFVADGSLCDGAEECECCNGSGTYHGECGECWGRGYEDCETCNGRGEVDCEVCDGTHEIECSNCNGDGGADDINGEWVDCSECDGGGTIECDECDSYGDVTCSDCDGSGEQSCSYCEGEGSFEEECDDCGGSGTWGDSDEGYGVECVSGILQEGDYTPIDNVFNYIGRNDWRVERDCGTHVHVGGDDLQANELSKLAILINIVEPMIYGSLDSDRIDGTYAKMANRDMVEYLITRGDDVTLQELANAYYGYERNLERGFNKYESERYYGLNLHSWFFRKTLEFRYFEGTTSREQAKNWIDLCIKLVDFAKYTSFEQLIVIGKDFYHLDDLQLQLGKMETLLGLEYNLRPHSNYAYDKARRNIANQFRNVTNISQAV